MQILMRIVNGDGNIDPNQAIRAHGPPATDNNHVLLSSIRPLLVRNDYWIYDNAGK